MCINILEEVNTLHLTDCFLGKKLFVFLVDFESIINEHLLNLFGFHIFKILKTEIVLRIISDKPACIVILKTLEVPMLCRTFGEILLD